MALVNKTAADTLARLRARCGRDLMKLFGTNNNSNNKTREVAMLLTWTAKGP